jgi:hypothetical protein
MASVLFWKCDCGIEWQALQTSERTITIYACVCGRRRTFNGRVTDLYYAPPNSGSRPVNWKQVTPGKFEIVS